MKTLLPAVIQKVTTLQDRSVKVILETQELTPTQMFELMSLFGKYGYMIFAEEQQEIVETKVPELPKREEDSKSPSERLRSVIYVLFEKSGKPGNNFEFFYLNYMDQLINLVKSKIDKYENK